MPRIYTFYHAPGKKVGCTTNYTRRRLEYPRELRDTILLLEVIEFETDKEAGDREWWWADKFELPRGTHYAACGVGGRVGGARAAKAGNTPFQKMTPAQHAESSRRTRELGLSGWQTGAGARASIKSPKHNTKQMHTCPHCGRKGRGLVMKRYHYDKCRWGVKVRRRIILDD